MPSPTSNTKTELNIHLTLIEQQHLITLLLENQRKGSYYGRKDQYYERTKRLLSKLGYEAAEQLLVEALTERTKCN